MKKLSEAKFAAKCLSLIDEVRKTGKPVVITRRGREVARLMPALDAPRKGEFLGHLEGFMEIVGDIESPIIPPEDWKFS